MTSRIVTLALLATWVAGCTAVVDAGSYRVATCEPLANTGCEAGQMCNADVITGLSMCVPEGTGALGTVCSSPTDCAPGSNCVLHALPDRGICLSYCVSDGDCSEQPGSIGCNSNPATGLGQCWQGCDPADPTSCGAGVACFAMGFVSACVSTGPQGRDALCGGLSFEDQCAPGFACLLNADGEFRCFTQCGPGLPACGGDESCTFALGEEIRPADPTEWGVCAVIGGGV
jgi:hypothetical protein